jgi:dihydroflavonol-4-reductase
MADQGWDRAVSGCDYVLHVASPFPPGPPKDENELVGPARDGTLRVLRASRDAGVKRVVVTSSFAAIGYGQASQDKVFTEKDWTNMAGPDVAPYIKSKTVAERAAWDFLEREGRTLEMSVINPVGIFGPVLGHDFSSSIAIIERLMLGMPAVPRVYFGIVDVRDLADLHVRVMHAEAAKGQRFIAVGGGAVSMLDVATMLRRHLGASAKRVPTRQFPDWLLRLLARFNPEAKSTLPQLGVIRQSTAEKARRLLGWESRPYEQTIADTADSLIRYGIVSL